ncbi:unnamed protein product [Musa textilis]
MVSPHLPLLRTPLLPLPPGTKKNTMITASSGRTRDQTKKGRPTGSSKKEMATRVCQPNDDEPTKPITKASASVLRLGRKDRDGGGDSGDDDGYYILAVAAPE